MFLTIQELAPPRFSTSERVFLGAEMLTAHGFVALAINPDSGHKPQYLYSSTLASTYILLPLPVLPTPEDDLLTF